MEDEGKTVDLRVGCDMYYENGDTGEGLFIEWEDIPEDTKGEVRKECQILRECMQRLEKLSKRLQNI